MLITRETDYALRVLRALSDGEQHTAGEISSTQLVPKQFAYKIIKKLDGGCRLAADLGKVTLYDLMAAMEEGSSVVACMDPAYPCPWRESHGGCAIHCGLAQVQQKLNEELRAHDLHTLIFGPSQAPSL